MSEVRRQQASLLGEYLWRTYYALLAYRRWGMVDVYSALRGHYDVMLRLHDQLVRSEDLGSLARVKVEVMRELREWSALCRFRRYETLLRRAQDLLAREEELYRELHRRYPVYRATLCVMLYSKYPRKSTPRPFFALYVYAYKTRPTPVEDQELFSHIADYLMDQEFPSIAAAWEARRVLELPPKVIGVEYRPVTWDMVDAPINQVKFYAAFYRERRGRPYIHREYGGRVEVREDRVLVVYERWRPRIAEEQPYVEFEDWGYRFRGLVGWLY